MSDLTKTAVWAVIIGAIGIFLMNLGAQGGLPTGFGLFDMSVMNVRITVTGVLIVIALILRSVYKSSKE